MKNSRPIQNARLTHGRNWRVLLAIILGFAFVIRVIGIWYGLPHVYWTDEYHEVMRAMALGAGSIDIERTSKGGFYLLLFFEYGLYYTLLRIVGIVANTREFAELFVSDPSAFYLMGRATAAIFGSATVAVVYWFARRAYGSVVGLLATLFLAVNVLHVGLSHRVGVDIPLVFFATLTLHFGLRVAMNGVRRDYVLAALCAALAMTTKLPGVLLLVPLLIAHTYAIGKSPAKWGSWFASRSLWLAAATFAIALIATNPGILFRVGELIGASPSTENLAQNFDVEDDADLDLVNRPNLYLYYFLILRDSMGWPLFGLALASTGYALWRRTAPDLMLVAYALVNYYAFSSTSSDVLYYPRYTLPIVMVLVILAARALADLALLIPRRRMATLSVVASILIAWPLVESVRSTYALTQTDTRTLAKEWFEKSVPPGARVLIEGSKIGASRETVPLIDSRIALERRIAYWKPLEPQQARFLEHRLGAHPGGGYDLHLMRLSDVESLDEYVGQGVEYFVVRPESFLGSRRAKNSTAQLLEDLRSDPRVKLLHRFKTESWTRLGPVIEIYQLRSGTKH